MVDKFSDKEIEARTGYRENKCGWGRQSFVVE